jgi:hypothetical protein
LNGQPYDERVIISLDLPHDVLFVLMQMAHKEDITFNQLIENILLAELEKYETA